MNQNSHNYIYLNRWQFSLLQQPTIWWIAGCSPGIHYLLVNPPASAACSTQNTAVCSQTDVRSSSWPFLEAKYNKFLKIQFFIEFYWGSRSLVMKDTQVLNNFKELCHGCLDKFPTLRLNNWHELYWIKISCFNSSLTPCSPHCRGLQHNKSLHGWDEAICNIWSWQGPLNSVNSTRPVSR